MLKEGTLDNSGGGEPAGLTRRQLLFGAAAFGGAAVLESTLGPIGTWALDSDAPEPVEPNLSDKITQDERALANYHRLGTIAVRYKDDYDTIGEPENLDNTQKEATATYIGNGVALTGAHLFQIRVRGKTYQAPYDRAYDALANHTLSNSRHYELFRGYTEPTFQEIGELDAMSVAGRQDPDLALVRYKDPSIGERSLPIEVTDQLPVPGERYSLCGYPESTDIQQQSWVTYLGPIAYSEAQGGAYNPQAPRLYVFVLNPASFANKNAEYYAAPGTSGSSVLDKHGKIFGVHNDSWSQYQMNDQIRNAIKKGLRRSANDNLAAMIDNPYDIAFGTPVNPLLLKPFKKALGKVTTQPRLTS